VKFSAIELPNNNNISSDNDDVDNISFMHTLVYLAIFFKFGIKRITTFWSK